MSRLLDWLSEECCGLLPLAYPTGGGDHDVIWTVIRYQMAEPCEVTIGQGRTAAAAIEDAMKDADDPTRWDYVPPQFRDDPRAAQETLKGPEPPEKTWDCVCGRSNYVTDTHCHLCGFKRATANR